VILLWLSPASWAPPHPPTVARAAAALLLGVDIDAWSYSMSGDAHVRGLVDGDQGNVGPTDRRFGLTEGSVGGSLRVFAQAVHRLIRAPARWMLAFRPALRASVTRCVAPGCLGSRGSGAEVVAGVSRRLSPCACGIPRTARTFATMAGCISAGSPAKPGSTGSASAPKSAQCARAVSGRVAANY